jgi:aromatic amino acid aminotransferase I / 2-aminoadipate transaminase
VHKDHTRQPRTVTTHSLRHSYPATLREQHIYLIVFIVCFAERFWACRIDVQGRVIRIDTFSKTMAPGMRLGWFTCSPVFAERLERIGETSLQSPCGLGQALAIQLLRTWKYEGYIRWLRGLRAQYAARRDHFIDVLSDVFELEARLSTQGRWAGCEVYTAYAKPIGEKKVMLEKRARKPLFEFVPPTSGMFVWVSRY